MDSQNRSGIIHGLVFTTAVVGICGTTLAQSSANRTAGFNLDAPTSDPIEVTYDSAVNKYELQVNMAYIPTAGAMVKHFMPPTTDIGIPILLDSDQPFPIPVWENILIIPIPGTPSVLDWHEEIETPGWEWTEIDGESLITRNDQPWPSTPLPMPGGPDPAKIWVQFPPISPGNVLDVHKALLWVGTPGNTVWGDETLDNGTAFDESFVRVIEYPTPEPGSIALLGLGLATLLSQRKSRG